jgi:hypothetical protein
MKLVEDAHFDLERFLEYEPAEHGLLFLSIQKTRPILT